MAGHSKWAKIKRQKAVTDGRRSQVFTRYLREIQVAAKMGGGDLSANSRLKRTVDTAKSVGVSNDNIEKAIKRGTGDLEGVEYEEVTYEAYGPAGIGLIIKTLTDNKTRTVGEVRHALGRRGGTLASTNAVSYQFSEQAVCTIAKKFGSEEQILELALDAGANDLQDADDSWEVYADLTAFDAVMQALSKLGAEVSGEIRMIPTNLIMVTEEEAEKVMSLLDVLDGLEDVQNVFTNFDTE